MHTLHPPSLPFPKKPTIIVHNLEAKNGRISHTYPARSISDRPSVLRSKEFQETRQISLNNQTAFGAADLRCIASAQYCSSRTVFSPVSDQRRSAMEYVRRTTRSFFTRRSNSEKKEKKVQNSRYYFFGVNQSSRIPPFDFSNPGRQGRRRISPPPPGKQTTNIPLSKSGLSPLSHIENVKLPHLSDPPRAENAFCGQQSGKVVVFTSSRPPPPCYT